jgi:regulator of sigma E protease
LILFTSIAATVVVLGILIFIHELGHFLVAKWLGVVVLRFSLGFGPKLLGFQRGETEYRLSAIPLGGYVKMLGEENEEEVPAEQMERSFANQWVGKRAAIVFAGPLSNILLALVIFTVIFAVSGIPYLTTEVGSVTADSPASRVGIQAGDKVLELNGKPVANWEEMSQAIQEEGKQPLVLKLQRSEQELTVEVVPELRKLPNIFGEAVERPVIGVTASGKSEIRKVNPLSAGYHSLVQTWNLTRLFFLTIVKLAQRVLPMDTLGGPILIAQMAGQQAQEGLLNLVYFLALISVNLAVLNLLPIPILDGGHLLFFLLEAVLRKPLSPRKIEYAQKVGLVLLIALMAIVFYNDIMRLMPGANKGLTP